MFAVKKTIVFTAVFLCVCILALIYLSTSNPTIQRQLDLDNNDFPVLTYSESADFIDFTYGLDQEGWAAVTELHYILMDYVREDIECDDTFIGTEVVIHEGVPGVEVVEIVSEVHNGVQVAVELGERAVVVPPQNLQVLVGTRDSAYIPTGTMIWPLDRPISSGFGNRVLFGRTEFHPGIDIPAPRGTPIVSADAGTVVSAGSEGGYGLMITLYHGDGLYTRYAHLHNFAVTVGQEVRQGQIIGFVGTTGRTTGPHLHFEVVQNGRQLNPMNFLPVR